MRVEDFEGVTTGIRRFEAILCWLYDSGVFMAETKLESESVFGDVKVAHSRDSLPGSWAGKMFGW